MKYREYVEFIYDHYLIYPDGKVMGRCIEQDSSKYDEYDVSCDGGDLIKSIERMEKVLAALKAVLLKDHDSVPFWEDIKT